MSAPSVSAGILDGTRNASSNRPVKIWSCCGGGVRSIIPLTIMCELEKRTGHAAHQMFDYMGGTSAGGMLVLALTTPSFEVGDVRPHQWTAERLREDHPIMMGEIFTPPGIFPSLRALFSRKYDETPRNRAIKQYLGNTLLKDSLTHVAIPAIIVSNNRRHVFTRTEARNMSIYRDLTSASVCQAATAAPTYFKTEGISTHYEESEIAFTDAGLGCNNPIFSTYVKASKEFGLKREFKIISVGTGCIAEDYITKKDMDQKGWLSYPGKLIQYMGHSSVTYIEDDVRDLLGANSVFSIDVVMEPRHFELDNATEKNINELEGLARRWIDAHQDELAELQQTWNPEKRKDLGDGLNELLEARERAKETATVESEHIATQMEDQIQNWIETNEDRLDDLCHEIL